MAKERNYDPVAAQRKADKAKAIKKGKANVIATRNERLAKKNPERIRKQISDLKAITEGGGKLTSHEQQVLEGLEKELKAVVKAREALGDKAPTFGSGFERRDYRDGGDPNNRKRRRDNDKSSDDDSDIPEDVRRIPMPRDTPPPIPKKYLDEWYAKRRAKWAARNGSRTNNSSNEAQGSSANIEPLGDSRVGGRGAPASTPTAPAAAPVAPRKPIEVKTVYEAKPVIRDLQKEAVSKFVPTVVRRKIDKSRGLGGLIEPEEADRLEKEGYLPRFSADPTRPGASTSAASLPSRPSAPNQVSVEDADDDED